ncbi:MAG: Gfo/Idh/MocA family oxidoreductase [Lachnospiraceae bacterium]|nr:Gfo/Idh/MocA family oxidoreductase [Lachnospiraceae bacterium]
MLKDRTKTTKKSGPVKVITYGTFDLFHEGHRRILERAKALGDYLIVGVTTDHFDEARGKLNTVDSIITRIENVKATGYADEIIVEDHEGQKIEDIQKYGVDIFVEGSDWRGYFDYLKQYCNVVYLERTPNISSTKKRNDRLKVLSLGIVGTGRIAPRFFEESRYVSGIQVVNAYNPTGDETADIFRVRCQCPVETGEYMKFLAGVDAVYISSPNETHYEYAKRAINVNKHVLCEKPMAFTVKESQELYDLAEEKGVVLMEGIRTAYLPGFQQLLNVAHSGVIGEIRDVEAAFTRLADPKSREMTDAEYGGAFLEFGSYSLLPIFKLLGLSYKDVMIDSITDPKTGIDRYTKIQIRYDGAMSTAKAGAGVKSEGQLIVAGTKGYILAQSPWWLTRGFDVRYEDSDKVDHYESSFKGDGFRYEINEFVTKINNQDNIIYKLTAEESIAMADIVERFMRTRNK